MRAIGERLKARDVVGCERVMRAITGEAELAKVVADLERRQITRRLADVAASALAAGIEPDQVREAVESGIRRASL